MFPFLQTVLWVGLIGWALIRFEKAIGAVLTALTKRIEDGDELAAPGGFRMVRHTPAAEEMDRLRQEAQEVVRNEAPEPMAQPPAQELDNAPEPPEVDRVKRPNSSVRDSLEVAARDVLDAQTLGLKWLGMVTNTGIHPSISVGDIALDGAMVDPNGKVIGLVLVKLVSSIGQLQDVSQQVVRLADQCAAYGTRLSVLLVKATDLVANTHLYELLPSPARDRAIFYEVDLPQLRKAYGLGN